MATGNEIVFDPLSNRKIKDFACEYNIDCIELDKLICNCMNSESAFFEIAFGDLTQKLYKAIAASILNEEKLARLLTPYLYLSSLWWIIPDEGDEIEELVYDFVMKNSLDYYGFIQLKELITACRVTANTKIDFNVYGRLGITQYLLMPELCIKIIFLAKHKGFKPSFFSIANPVLNNVADRLGITVTQTALLIIILASLNDCKLCDYKCKIIKFSLLRKHFIKSKISKYKNDFEVLKNKGFIDYTKKGCTISDYTYYIYYNIFNGTLTKKERFIRNNTLLSESEKIKTVLFFTKHPNYENRIDWNCKDIPFSEFEKIMELDN